VLSAAPGHEVLELEVTPILDDRGAVTHGLVQLRPCIAQVESVLEGSDEWRSQLAALPSRELLLDRVQGGLNRLKRRRMRHMALIVLNIDRFRVVTESLGEQSGNELLVNMARTIESLLMDSDTVAWLGADEFGVFLEDLRDPSDAIRLCMRLEGLLTDPIRVDGSELFITCSAGIALAGSEHVQARALFRDANTALHRAKKSSNAMYCIFDRDMHREARERLSLETDLRRAIERDELLLNFQPIVDLNSGSVDAFEALVRWSRDTQLVPPNDFIPLAEDTGLIVDVGRWVLDTACREAKGWLDAAGQSAPSVSVNVSPIQFEHQDIFEHVTDALDISGLPPNRLKLEITESCLMENVKQKIALLKRLRSIGVTTQVDDFGTGYSSLGLLTQLPVDSLKIDRSFVGRMSTWAADGKVVRAVIELAHSLGMKVTAEGIEFDDQRDELLALACDRGQGYLFARPMSAQAAVKTMKRLQPPTAQPGGNGGGGEGATQP
jgi:Amt family ammonium transporter